MLGPALVRLALRRGDPKRARQVAASIAELAQDNPTISSMAGAALRCQGLATDDAEVLLMAVDAYASGSRRFELALTCEDAGTAFARATKRTAPGRCFTARSIFTKAWRRHASAARPKPSPVWQGSAVAGAARAAGHRAAGTASLTPSAPSSHWLPRACPTRRSETGYTFPGEPCRRTSRTSSSSWTSPHALSSPPNRSGRAARRSSTPADSGTLELDPSG